MLDLPERLRKLVEDTDSIVISDALEEAADVIGALNDRCAIYERQAHALAAQQDVREKIEKVRHILKILEHENMIAGDALDLLNEVFPQS